MSFKAKKRPKLLKSHNITTKHTLPVSISEIATITSRALPSKNIINQLTEISNILSRISNIDNYSKLIADINKIKVPDFSVLQSMTSIDLNSDLINRLSESFKSRLIALQDRPERTTIKDKIDEIAETAKEIIHVVNLPFLEYRIHSKAYVALSKNEFGLEDGFSSSADNNGAVVSIDIRRSTELMLKAKYPLSFATFISGLTDQLKKCIILNFGVFDKFTGDGLLSYFPDFYSGTYSIIHALKAAIECHSIFNVYYKTNKSLFSTVLLDTGLGIGIDYGKLSFVNINREPTIVGVPMVYACRLSGAPHGTTFFNQTAFDKINELHFPIMFSEEAFEIKHEGKVNVYKLKSLKDGVIKKPVWFESKH